MNPQPSLSLRNFRREHLIRLIAVVALGLVAASLLVDPLRVNYDVAAAISIAQLLLRGATPYVDYVNLNPPLIHYLHILPAWVAGLVGLHPIVTFSWLIMALTGWTIFSVRSVCRTLDDRAKAVVIEAVVVLTIALLTWKLAVYDAFGQREHIFVLLYLPYFLLRWTRLHPRQPMPRGLTLALGALAAVGICLKPHFLLIALAAEGFLVFEQRSLRKGMGPEVLALVAVGIAYAAHFLILPAEAREGIQGLLRLLATGGYGAYGDSTAFDLLTADPKVFTIALAPFVFVRDPHREVGSLLRLSGVAVLASIVEAVIQGRAFIYHWIPAWTWTLLILFLAVFGYGIPLRLADAFARLRTDLPGAARVAITGISYLVVVVSILIWTDVLSRTSILAPSPPSEIRRALVANSESDDTVYLVTAGTGLVRSVLQAGRLTVSKYFPDFPIAFALYEAEADASTVGNADQLPDALQARLLAIEAEIATARPDIIIIDGSRACRVCQDDVDFVTLLSRTGFTERVLLSYRKVGVFGENELYSRIPEAGAYSSDKDPVE